MNRTEKAAQTMNALYGQAHAAGGNSKETLLAALTVCLPYIGFPRTLNALGCINEVLPEAKAE